MALQTLEHFDTIDSEHLERLSGARSTLCASIYIPTHRCGNDVQQDPIRLKNAVAEARRQLVEFGQSGDGADDLLRPAVELMVLDASDDFWQHQSDGLAILLSAEEACLFQLPTKFDEEVAVSDRFRLKPLLRSMNSNEEFHLVAVSRGAVRVFRGCRSGLKEEHFADLPESLQEFSSHDQQRGHNRHSFKVRKPSRRIHRCRMVMWETRKRRTCVSIFARSKTHWHLISKQSAVLLSSLASRNCSVFQEPSMTARCLTNTSRRQPGRPFQTTNC
ncbi:MAG: hypothetical protein R3C17_13385 [Planctomycetaceae bacterium]